MWAILSLVSKCLTFFLSLTNNNEPFSVYKLGCKLYHYYHTILDHLNDKLKPFYTLRNVHYFIVCTRIANVYYVVGSVCSDIMPQGDFMTINLYPMIYCASFRKLEDLNNFIGVERNCFYVIQESFIYDTFFLW